MIVASLPYFYPHKYNEIFSASDWAKNTYFVGHNLSERGERKLHHSTSMNEPCWYESGRGLAGLAVRRC